MQICLLVDREASLKLLLLTSERGLRGGEGQLLLLAQGLVGRGHQVVIGAPPDAAIFARLPSSIERIAVTARGDLDLLAARRLRAVLRVNPPDLVHAFTARSHGLARLALPKGLPLVVSRLVSFPAGKGMFGGWKYRRGVAAYAAVSRSAVEALLAAGVSPSTIHRIPTALPPLPAPSRDRSQIRASLGLSATGPVIGSVSHLAVGKGFSFLLQAAAALLNQFQNLEVCLVGEGPARGALEAEAARVGLNYRLKLPGRATSALAVAEALSAFDVFALPSLSEGLPTAVLEAMAAGTPVVASAVGGLPELIVDRVNGRLVPPGKVPPLVQALTDLLASPEEGRRLAATAQTRLDPYQPDRVVTAYEELYARVLQH
jgi:glycosyltransferase involved in cell wall biosynthesis